jgi:ABC-2 type transport system permease protein
VDPSLYILPTFNLFALGFAVLGLSVFCSARDQYRWKTIGTVIGIYVLQLLLFILSKSTAQTHFLTPLTFLAAYQPDWIVQRVSNEPATAWQWIGAGDLSRSGADLMMSRCEPLAFITILLSLGLVAYFLAWNKFRVRDLPAPN